MTSRATELSTPRSGIDNQSVTMNKLEMCNQVLTANGFEVFLAADPAHVRQLFFAKVQPAIDVKVISWGDSMTMIATRALDDLMATPGLEVIRPSHRQPPL